MQLRRDDGRVVRVGHRGSAALAPENSLAAIEAAAACGADAVELDVARGAGGSLLLSHALASPAGAPDLDDALALVARLGLCVQLDVKAPGLEEPLVDALARRGLLERSFVSSCSPPILRTLAAVAPGLPRALGYPEDRFGISGRPLLAPAVDAGLLVLRTLLPRRLPGLLAAARAQAASLAWQVVSPAAIAACHAAGAAAYAWTVNDPQRAKTLVESGIDGIISDDPGILPGP